MRVGVGSVAPMSQTAQTSIRECSLEHLLAQGDALFRAHYDEIARNKRVMVLDPDVDRYRTIQSAGALFVLVAEQDTAVVGYSVNFFGPHIHYQGLVVCTNDVLFLDAAHRRGGLGHALVRATERAAVERGARLMLWHAKQGTALDRALPRWGYSVQDVIYSKAL